MPKVNQKQARADAQSRYYQKNKDHLIARAKQRYQERRLAQPVAPEPTQNEPILESPMSPTQSKKPKSHFSKWIQQLISGKA